MKQGSSRDNELVEFKTTAINSLCERLSKSQRFSHISKWYGPFPSEGCEGVYRAVVGANGLIFRFNRARRSSYSSHIHAERKEFECRPFFIVNGSTFTNLQGSKIHNDFDKLCQLWKYLRSDLFTLFGRDFNMGDQWYQLMWSLIQAPIHNRYLLVLRNEHID